MNRIYALMIEDFFGHFSTSRDLANFGELRALKDVGDVGVPFKLVALLLAGSQVAAHKAKGRLVQRHAQCNASLFKKFFFHT